MRSLNLFALIIAGIILPFVSLAQPERITDQWNPAGEIKDLFVHPDGQSVYIAGAFNYWTKYRKYATVLDRETFLPLPGQELLNGEVTDVIADGTGGWYVAGIFDIINARPQNGLFHLDAELNIITGFPNVKGQVNDLKLVGDTLIIAGNFSSVGGHNRRGLAAISVTTKEVLEMDVKINGSIKSVDVWNDTLFLGGDFNAINHFGNYGTRLNKFTGNVDTYFDTPDGEVTASTPDGNGGWFIGGSFRAIGDSLRYNLAHIGSDGKASAWKCDLGYVEGPFNSVTVLEVHDNYLYVGGEFKKIGGVSRNNSARVGAQTGEVDEWEPNFFGSPNSFAFMDQTVFAAGKLGFEGKWVTYGGVVDLLTGDVAPEAKNIDFIVQHSVSDGNGGFFVSGPFTAIGDSSRIRLAHLDANGSVTSFTPNFEIPNTQPINDLAYHDGVLYLAGWTNKPITGIDMQGNEVLIEMNEMPSMSFSVLKVIGDTLFIGGQFINAGIPSGHFVRAVSLPDFQEISSINLGGEVTDLEYVDNNLYITGSFKSFNQVPYAALLDAGTLQNTNTEMQANGPVTVSIGDGQGGFFIAGEFDGVGEEYCTGIAYINPDGNTECIDIDANKDIRALFLIGDTLLLGGDFTEVNGIARTRFAAWSISNANLLEWSPSFDSTLKAFELHGDTLFVGGSFSQIDGQIRTSLAGFNLSNSTLLPFAHVIGGEVHTIHIHADELFVGGNFTAINSINRGRLASFNLGTMEMTNWNPNANSSVYTIVSGDNRIFVGGTFSQIGTTSRLRLADFDYGSSIPNSLTTNYSYYTNRVTTMATDGDKLLIGGYFYTYNDGHFLIVDLSTNQVVNRPRANAYVRTIAGSGDKFFVGGDFTAIGGWQTSGLIGVDMTTGSFNGFNPTFPGAFSQIEANGNFLYAGGGPGAVNGTEVGRLAIFDLSTGDVVNTQSYFTEIEYSVTTFSTMKRFGDLIYVGLKTFNPPNYYVPNRNNLLCLNTLDNTLTDFDPRAYGDVNTISVNDDGIFVGGDLIHIGGTKLDELAAYDIPSGVLLPEKLVTAYGTISSLAVHNNLLIAGGSNISVSGWSQKSLVAYDFQTEQAFNFAGVNPDGVISTLKVYDDVLYFGGTGMGPDFKFVSSYDFNTNEFIQLNLPLTLTNSQIFDMEVDESGLFVSHSSGSLPNSTRYVSAYNRFTGERIDDWGIDVTGELYPQIHTMSLQGDHLYIGGNTKLISNNRLGNLASINLSDGQQTSWKPSANNTVNKLLARENGIYAGGSFTHINSSIGPGYIVRLDKSTGIVNSSVYGMWIKNEVYDIAYNPDDELIYMSGKFNESDGSSRNHLVAFSEETNYIDFNWNADPRQRPVHLTFHNNSLWTQDYHPYAGDSESCYVRKLLPSGAFSNDSIPVFGNYLRAMAFQADKMFLGGRFKGAGGVLRHSLLEIDAATGQLTDFNPDIPFDEIVRVIGQDDKLIIMGKVNQKYRIMGIDINTYEVLPEYADQNDFTDYNDQDMLLHNGEYFYRLKSDPLSRRDIQTGASLPIPYFGYSHLELEASSGFLYLRSRLTSNDLFERIDIEGAEFTDFDLQVDSLVEFMAERNGKLYMAGHFSEINNMPRKGLACFDGATGLLDEWTVDGIADGKMIKIHSTDESIYHSMRVLDGYLDVYQFRHINPETGALSEWSLPIDAADVVEAGGRLYVAGSPYQMNSIYDTTFGAYELESCNTEVSCNNINVYLDENGEATAEAAEVGVGTVSDCTIQEFILSQTEFTCDNLGENEVSLTPNTGIGLSVSCNAIVTVIDTISPVLTVQDIDFQIPVEGIIEISPEEFVVEMYDNCEIVSVSILGQATFTCEDQGQTFDIQLVATDNSGNQASYPIAVSILASQICCEAEANFIGNTATVCAGETVALPIMFTGLPPFQVGISNNVDTLYYTINNPSIDSIYVAPFEATTYSLTSISDLECLAFATGSFEVTVEQAANAGSDQDIHHCADGELVSFSDYIHSDASNSAYFPGVNQANATTDLSGTYYLVDVGQTCPNDTAQYQFLFTEIGVESNLSVFCDQPNPYFYEVTFEVIGGTPPYTVNTGFFTGNVFTSDLISVLDEPETVFTVSDLIGCQFDVEAFVIDTNGNGACDNGELVGCMDPDASDYNPLATIPGLCSAMQQINFVIDAVLADPPVLTIDYPPFQGERGIDGLLNEWEIEIFPNPGSPHKPTNVLFKEFSSDAGLILQVRDIAGRLIQTQKVFVQKGNSQSVLSFKETLSHGIYFISFISENTQTTKRLVIME